MKKFPPLLLVMLTLGAVLARGADAPKLTFNPPDTTVYTIKTTSVRELWLDSTRMSIDSTFSTVAANMTKTADGYRLVTDQKSFAGKKSGAPYNDILINLMLGLKVTLTINSVGEATGITGFEDMFDRLDKMGDSQTVAPFKEALSPRLMSDKVVNDWNNAMADIVGRTFTINALRTTSAPLTLPDETHLILMEVSLITDTVRVDGRLHARIRVISDTNPDRLARQLGRDRKFVSELFKVPEESLGKLASAVSHYLLIREFLVDVTTLLMSSEQSRQEMVVKQVDVPGERVMSSIIETTSRQYTYTRR